MFCIGGDSPDKSLTFGEPINRIDKDNANLKTESRMYLTRPPSNKPRKRNVVVFQNQGHLPVVWVRLTALIVSANSFKEGCVYCRYRHKYVHM